MLAALWLALSSGPAAAAGCDAAAPPAMGFAEAKGVRTKWLTLARDARNTIQPDLEGLPLAQWMKNLEAIGVNLAEINLEPAHSLASHPAVSDAQLLAAVSAFYTPAATLDPHLRQQADGYVQNVFPHRLYTAEQRNQVQLDFLRRLEALRRHGDIVGSVRFLIHQRLWFRQEAAVGNREHRAAQFAGDMASFINLAERNCLGHWLAGVRLGENSNADMNELAPLIVELAERIDAATNGWLKSHMFLANGGGWGAEYRGIGKVVGADGQPFPFFARIAAATGSFSFGYKWMQFHDRVAQGIQGHMQASQCGQGRHCNLESVDDWNTYLGATLGFTDLISFIDDNLDRYPKHAHVVFVGDSSDSVNQMVAPGADGRLSDKPAMVSLRQLFHRGKAAGFGGKVFINAYDSVKVETELRRRDDGKSDVGRMLYTVDSSGQSRLLPHSLRLWQDWPEP